jgi:hypothetical protein
MFGVPVTPPTSTGLGPNPGGAGGLSFHPKQKATPKSTACAPLSILITVPILFSFVLTLRSVVPENPEFLGKTRLLREDFWVRNQATLGRGR